LTNVNRAAASKSNGEARTPRRATLADVAALARVSLATADRVVHDRRGTGEATRKRVLAAAVKLDYIASATVERLLRPAPQRLLFVLPRGTNRFIDLLAEYAHRIEAHLTPYNVRGKVRWVEAFKPEVLAQELLRQGRKADAIAYVPLDHPMVRDATNRLVEEGRPVITLATDLAESKRTAYVGLDNYAAGRTAAQVMAHWAHRGTGSIVLISGSPRYRGHGERELGFRNALAEMYSNLNVTASREGHDDPQRTYQRAKELITQNGGLVGLYNVGGGQAGVARALREAGLAGKVVFIGHELTPETRAFLFDGTMAAVIHQNPQIEVMNCVRVMANVRAGHKPMEGIEPLRIALILKENVP